MKKKYVYFIFSIILFGLVCFQKYYVKNKLEQYVYREIEKKYGTKKLAKKQEKKILSIAKKMGVIEPIIIRKMNTNSLRTFGYYNAFACFPLLFNFIPIGDKPFLFISEGFFEDLSQEEQVFLIGHEMIHIKERHSKYLNFFLYSILLGLFLLWLFLKKRYKNFAKKRAVTKIYNFIFNIIFILLLFIFLLVPSLISLSYQRHLERVADYTSMEILKSYDGGIKLLERWKREFKISDCSSDSELFSDHPSNAERKRYCLKFKNKSEGHHEKKNVV